MHRSQPDLLPIFDAMGALSCVSEFDAPAAHTAEQRVQQATSILIRMKKAPLAQSAALLQEAINALTV